MAESCELLRDWNQNQDCYEIYYIDRLGHRFLLKAVNLEHHSLSSTFLSEKTNL